MSIPFEFLDRVLLLSSPDMAVENILSKEGALLLVQKPYGETSFHAVNQIRKAISRATGIRRVKCGHAGTLDPLATGLLIIATRGKTKVLSEIVGLDKTYRLRMRLGATSPSFDLERPIEITGGEELLTREAVEAAVRALEGEHEQIPPIYSAIKQQGKPVYLAARAGDTPVMTARTIMVHNIEILSDELPFVSFRVRVSKGTYIRSLVRDVAATLGTGGLLIDLEREAIGEWRSDDATTLNEIVTAIRQHDNTLAETHS